MRWLLYDIAPYAKKTAVRGLLKWQSEFVLNDLHTVDYHFSKTNSCSNRTPRPVHAMLLLLLLLSFSRCTGQHRPSPEFTTVQTEGSRLTVSSKGKTRNPLHHCVRT